MTKQLGDWKDLWPSGVQRAQDLPWKFVEAWSFATVILSWQENLPKEDVPPRHIWEDGKALQRHFAYITKRREDSSRFGEAPEGTLEDAAFGDVTLRNKFVTDYLHITNSHRSYDDFSEV